MRKALSSVIAALVVISCAGCSNVEAEPHSKTNGKTSTDIVAWQYPNGARNAISITFDDARESQVDVGVAILDKHNVKGTFYVMPEPVQRRLAQWQAVAENGHEIGNHTQSHLCTGNFQWLRAMNKGLEQVDLTWMRDDIEKTNQFIESNLGVTPHSFAYPCGNTFVGRGAEVQSYVPLIADLFTTGRTWLDETANDANYTDFAQLTGIRIDGMTFEQIKATLDALRFTKSWIILAGHEVGQKGMYTIDSQALESLIVYLKDPANGYWLDTVDNVANYLKQHRDAPK
ncbi:polysaccharide deacetylase family protein [Pseudoalteromonas sp. S16_S37]|uniref:polysaccharide deacetylase family protein n=1 Tax=Pseudoalteromonas sp. S16_S37 TaxID=2720228 RepID=UPI0016807DFF|nr:polysaccharide deacetylase family protein [Pseudoalteromonas sp. S16_S37]MBD1584408.1 polysaccharide deacetylase family protein [Pseudoalteromonas sp. S16_S37]